MTNLAIVVPVYSRIDSLKRLIWSLENAKYPNEVPLVFKTHQGVDSQVWSFIQNYQWPFGQKKCLFENQNLGLEENLRQCGDLSLAYGAVVILEDDCLVSPYFYHYALAAIDFYKNNDKIAQISLYRYLSNPINKLPHHIVDFNTFFIQKTSTYGQIFTAESWGNFRQWLAKNSFNNEKIPNYIIDYGYDNWEYQHNAYIINNDLYSVWPSVSYASCQSPKGVHHPNNIDSGFFQVPLAQKPGFAFARFANGNKYDPFFECSPNRFLELFEQHQILSENVEIDLHGLKPLPASNHKKYWLTSKPCKNPLRTFSDDIKPKEMNVLLNSFGRGISLCRTLDIVKKPKTDNYQRAKTYFSEVGDIGLLNFLHFKWLKYVERKRLNK